jgi:hypothetical protein
VEEWCSRCSNVVLVVVIIIVKFLYRILVGKHEGKKQLGRPWSRWKDNIATNLLQL